MKHWLIFWMLLAPLALLADNLRATAQSDLQQALQELRAQREQIAAEKAELIRTYNELEARVREQRRQWDLLKLTAGQQGARYEERRIELAELEQQHGAFQAALADYMIKLETNLYDAELSAYQQQLGDFNGDLSPAQARAVLDFGLARLTEAQGGRKLAGQAINAQGEAVDGQFLFWGPMTYFQPEWGGDSGFVLAGNGVLPRVAPFSSAKHAASLKQAIAGENASLPIDASNGRALRLEQQHETLGEHIRSGGIWVWPILTLAAIALIVMLYKTIQIVQVRLPSSAVMDAIYQDLSAGKQSEAKEKIEALRDPAQGVLREALQRAHQPREVLEDILLEHIIRWQMHWERGLSVLAVTAAVSPLLGLLGTVTGMIATFRLIGVYGSGDARPLSGGISEALVTTELGLLVAIPALIAHAILSRKAQSLTSDLEGLATRFIDDLPTAKND